MISQADILKTLINQKCTDDAVMSTALSPDCTLPKLLEKLTEAERFDLALDISMKLGLDVIALWRTWAMRALRHRNFSLARQNFRHCFQRLRLPGASNTTIQEQLLNTILWELCRMDESEPSLDDEIESIKRRPSELDQETGETDAFDEQLFQEALTSQGQCQAHRLVADKPVIYAECLDYLTSYGGTRDFLRFFVRNSLWDQTVELLLKHADSETNLREFFIAEVVHYLSARGQLSHLLKAFQAQDSDLVLSASYFKAIYESCYSNGRYNLLYYIQSSIGDHVAAAGIQVSLFLAKPVACYRELNLRVSNLVNALKNYQCYLAKLQKSDDDDDDEDSRRATSLSSSLALCGSPPKPSTASKRASAPKSTTSHQSKSSTSNNRLPQSRQPEPSKEKSCSESRARKQKPSLFSSMPRNLVESQIKLIDRQIEITRNFANNEVSGCLNGIQFNLDDDNQRLRFPTGVDELQSAPALNAIGSGTGTGAANKPTNVLRSPATTCHPSGSSGCAEDSTMPVTLFDSSLGRRTFFAALVLIYFDLSCSTYFSKNGLDLARQLIEEYNLHEMSVYKLAIRILMKDESCNILQNAKLFLDRIKAADADENQPDCYYRQSKARSVSDVCDQVIREFIEICDEPDYKMELAKLLSDEARIELYIAHGKLSNAERLACSMNRADYVASIIKEAERLNQNHVKTICQLWLAKHETRNLLR